MLALSLLPFAPGSALWPFKTRASSPGAASPGVLLPLLLLCACAGASREPRGVAGGDAALSPEPKRDSSEGRRERSEAEGEEEGKTP